MKAQRSGALELWRSCRYGSAEVRSPGKCAGMKVGSSGGRAGMEVQRSEDLEVV